MILTKSTHKAHKSIFYPGSGRPLANDPTSYFGGLSGGGSELQWMNLSGYQEAAFYSFYTSCPFTSLPFLSLLRRPVKWLPFTSLPMSCLGMALLSSPFHLLSVLRLDCLSSCHLPFSTVTFPSLL